MPDSTPENLGPRVVVGVDASPASQAALAWALDEARLRRTALHVVHAWQFPFETAGAAGMLPGGGEMKLWAEEVIDDALAAVDVGDDVTVLREAVIGPATAVLLEACRGASLLVVGTRGHSRLTGLFLGSASQYLAVHAPCPVLVVHGPRPSPAGEEPAPAAEPAAAPATEEGAAGAGGLEEIPEEECLALLQGQEVGRLVVVRDGAPVAFPVNYTLDGRTVAVRTDPGTKLDWGTLGPVAFEVDDIDRATHQGWSVLVQGTGRDVTEGVDAWSQGLRSSPLQPWAAGGKDHWIAIASPTITGRRIRPRPAEGSAE